jgi:hypothetical protein
MSNPESNPIFLKVHLSERERKFSKFKRHIKNIIFNMFFVLLKDYRTNLLIECLGLLVEYIQILYYPFDGYVKYKIIFYLV